MTLRPPRRREAMGSNTVMVLPSGTQVDLGHASRRSVLPLGRRSWIRLVMPPTRNLISRPSSLTHTLATNSCRVHV